MLLDPQSPLAVNYGYVLKRLPWFLQYLSYCKPARVEAIAAALAPLIEDCVEQHQALAAGTAAEQLIQRGPYVFLYEDRAAYQADSYGWILRKRHGVEWDELSDGEVKNLLPGLADRPWFAAVIRNKHGHISDPGRLVKTLAAHVIESGAQFIKSQAHGFVRADDKVTGVRTDRNIVTADAVVVATGVWSEPLVRELAVKLPLESERGYHVVLTKADTQLRSPVLWTKGKCVFTPMDAGLRIAGTVEFAGLDAPLNHKRTQLLLKHGKTLFPKLAYESVEEWLGHRPALADSLPAIGRLQHYPNVILALGHHHLGLMAGPKTGRLVAQMIAGQSTSIDCRAYSPDRFNRR
jgi:D-amino-acid dehydrogenase